MKKTRLLARLTAVGLALVLLLSVMLPIASLGDAHTVDLSRGGSQYTVTVGTADLLELLLGAEVGEAERSYLLTHGDYTVVYDEGITTATIHADYSDGTLSLTVYEYEYTSDKDSSVTWIPDYADLGGERKTLVYDGEGGYRTSFAGVSNVSEASFVTVGYTLGITVPKEMANAVLNLAYTDALYYESFIAEKRAEFESLMAEYNIASDKYKAYLSELLEYNDKLTAFNDYEAAKKLSDDAWKKYNDYLDDLADFNYRDGLYQKYLEDCEAVREEWIKYGDYQEELLNYGALKAIYDTELAKLESCRDKLAIIDLAKVKMSSLERTVYHAVMGGLVDTVLNRREDLESNVVGAPPLVISMAGNATEVMRVLLTDYFALETEVAKYNYYTANYEAFRDCFTDLFKALDCLYSNGMIRAALIDQDKNEKYKILVAQLFMIASLLSDTPISSVLPSMVKNSEVGSRYKEGFVYDSNFYIKDGNKKQYLGDLLGDVGYNDTNSATPTIQGFPTLPAEPIEPEYVAQPTDPDIVLPPGDPPEPVDEPDDPPIEVLHPGDPPEEVDEPTRPEEYTPSKEIADLLLEKGVTLTERTELFDTDPTITVKKAVNKYFYNTSTVDVAFLSETGELLYLTTVDYGSAASYSGLPPTKAEDDRAVYTFAGWKDESGERVDLSSVTENLSLTPYFAEAIKSYTVTWITDDSVTVSSVPYGTVPEFGSVPTRPMTSEYKYTFAGWDPAPVPVVGDATYTATFRADPIISSKDKITVIYDSSENKYVVDAHLSYDMDFDLTNVFELASVGCSVDIVSRFASVSFSSDTVKSLYELGASRVELETRQINPSTWHYGVHVTDASGNPVFADGNLGISVAHQIEEEYRDRTRLYSIDADGKRRTVRYTNDSYNVYFEGDLYHDYCFGNEYVINSRPTSSASVSISTPSAMCGDTVEITVTLAEGKRLEKLYYLSASGEEIVIPVYENTAVLQMPSEDVTIIPVAVDIIYTITFVNDGQTLTTVYCRPGEIPTAPEDPRKASDGVWEYTFSGWSDEITAADSDKTYVAVYEKSPVPIKEQGTGTSIYATLLTAVIVITSVVAVAVIGVIAVIVVRLKRY